MNNLELAACKTHDARVPGPELNPDNVLVDQYNREVGQ